MSGGQAKPITSLHRCLILSLIAAIVITSLSTALMFVVDPSDQTAAQWVGCPAIVSLCLGLLVTCASALRREQRKPLRIAASLGTAFAIAGTFAVLIAIMMSGKIDHSWEEALGRIGTALLALAIGLAYTVALALVRAKTAMLRAAVIGTALSAWSAAGVLIFIVVLLEYIENQHDFSTMIILFIAWVVSIVLTLVGTVAVPVAVISKAGRRAQASESIDPRVQLHFGCPRCGERQTHRPGYIKCVRCSAGMFIEIEEPRCECGYLLYRLTGSTCPECGRAVGLSPPGQRTLTEG